MSPGELVRLRCDISYLHLVVLRGHLYDIVSVDIEAGSLALVVFVDLGSKTAFVLCGDDVGWKSVDFFEEVG